MEGVDARDVGELGDMERAGAHTDELRGEVVAPVGADAPHGGLVVPCELGDLGVEQGVVVQAELAADAPAVLEDLGRVGVLLGGHVSRLLEKREVDVRRGVALGARIAVPVPRPAEVAGPVDDPHVVHARPADAGARDEAGEPAADEGEGHVIGARLAWFDRHVGVDEQ